MKEKTMKPNELNDKEQAAMEEGLQFATEMMNRLPKGDRLAMEAHMTGVLTVFWGAAWNQTCRMSGSHRPGSSNRGKANETR